LAICPKHPLQNGYFFSGGFWGFLWIFARILGSYFGEISQISEHQLQTLLTFLILGVESCALNMFSELTKVFYFLRSHDATSL